MLLPAAGPFWRVVCHSSTRILRFRCSWAVTNGARILVKLDHWPWPTSWLGASSPKIPGWSELNRRREHDPPHRAPVLRSDNARNRAGIAILAVNTGVRLAQVDMVERIEE